MYRPVNHGYIETVIGPMYSGKSEELIRRLKRAKIAKQNIVVFKPQIDDRYSKEDVVSHSGDSIKAIPISDSNQIYDHIDEKTQVVGIDEVQFFDDNIVDVAIDLADQGIRVIENIFNQNVRILPDKNYCDNYLASQQVNSFINIFFKL